MKLLNQSIKHLSIFILIIIGIWGVAFFYIMVDEIKENVDEGLENFKRQIIYKTRKDKTLLMHNDFEEAFYTIREINRTGTFSFINQFTDTIIYIQDANDAAPRPDPVRMLTTTFENNGRYYELKIINPMVERDDLIRRLLWNMVWLYIILIITIILVNNIVLKKIWEPFYKLLHKIQTYQLGGDGRLPEVRTKTKEFQDLQKSIDTLLNQNIRVYEQQKQFIGNAAHELQTPLAIAITKLELLLEKGNLQKDQAKSIAETMNIMERLTRLNKSLLLLSRIENKQFPNHQPVLINEVVKEKTELFNEIAHHKKLSISFTEEDDIVKEMDPALAEIMIGNLLRNALYHNVPNGEIIIRIKRNRLLIKNTGHPKALDPEQIFKRFYKSNPQKESTGLGLPIVKAIADLYDILISYSYLSPHHLFIVHWNPTTEQTRRGSKKNI